MANKREGRPKTARHVNLTNDQFQALEILSACLLGRPSISSLIREAIDQLIRRELAQRPEIAEELQNTRERSDKVVPIRPIKREG
jgi:hypothetical protein